MIRIIGNIVLLDVNVGNGRKRNWDVNFPGRNNKETKGIDFFYHVPVNSRAHYTIFDGTDMHFYFGGYGWFAECPDGEHHPHR